MSDPRMSDTAELREEYRRLTEAAKDAKRRLSAAQGDIGEAVIAAYRENPKIGDIIGRFGISHGEFYYFRNRHKKKTGETLPKAIRPKGAERAPGARRRDPAPIIAAVIETRSLTETALRFGITRERVRQIVARYERETGQRLERKRQGGNTFGPRVTWTCERCRRSWTTIPSKVGCCKADCIKPNSRSRRAGEFIQQRRDGLTWAEIVRRDGLDNRYTGHIQRVVWCELRRTAPEQIPEIFAGSRINYLQKRWPLPDELRSA